MKSDLTKFDKATSFARRGFDEIITLGKVSRQEHLHLTTALLSDHHNISDRDRLKINKILESIRFGKVQLID